MAYLKWTSHFGWFVSHFGWSAVLTIHRHVLSFGPLSHRKTSHFGRFLKFYKKGKIYDGLFQIKYALFRTNYALFQTKNQNLYGESKSIMVYLKWTSHFGWSVMLTIHRHVHSFGPLSHRKTSHFGIFLKFYKKAKFNDGPLILIANKHPHHFPHPKIIRIHAVS